MRHHGQQHERRCRGLRSDLPGLAVVHGAVDRHHRHVLVVSARSLPDARRGGDLDDDLHGAGIRPWHALRAAATCVPRRAAQRGAGAAGTGGGGAGRVGEAIAPAERGRGRDAVREAAIASRWIAPLGACRGGSADVGPGCGGGAGQPGLPPDAASDLRGHGGRVRSQRARRNRPGDDFRLGRGQRSPAIDMLLVFSLGINLGFLRVFAWVYSQ
mmetsp:Transcript_27228/g.87721  ORF Transcript_27228/g.87721 Transcript_27228/m.87721 type:complete len:214 (-) Transcript_27228:13-654(-)